MNYGTDLKIKQGFGGGVKMAAKASPRSGAARGQGMGMGGYNASAVNKAMSSVKGSGGTPTYYCGGSKMGR